MRKHPSGLSRLRRWHWPSALFSPLRLSRRKRRLQPDHRCCVGYRGAECSDENQDGVCDTPAQLSNADTSAQSDEERSLSRVRAFRRDEFSTVEPITVITAAEITQSASTAPPTRCRAVRSLRAPARSLTHTAGFVTDGGHRANTLGLRGLGPYAHPDPAQRPPLAPGGRPRLGSRGRPQRAPDSHC